MTKIKICALCAMCCFFSTFAPTQAYENNGTVSVNGVQVPANLIAEKQRLLRMSEGRCPPAPLTYARDWIISGQLAIEEGKRRGHTLGQKHISGLKRAQQNIDAGQDSNHPRGKAINAYRLFRLEYAAYDEAYQLRPSDQEVHSRYELLVDNEDPLFVNVPIAQYSVLSFRSESAAMEAAALLDNGLSVEEFRNKHPSLKFSENAFQEWMVVRDLDGFDGREGSTLTVGAAAYYTGYEVQYLNEVAIEPVLTPGREYNNISTYTTSEVRSLITTERRSARDKELWSKAEVIIDGKMIDSLPVYPQRKPTCR